MWGVEWRLLPDGAGAACNYKGAGMALAFMGRGLHDQRRYDRPTLAGEHVVGPAGCRGVHRFDADARFDQTAIEGRRDELQSFAASEDHQLGFQRENPVEVRRRERLYGAGRPRQNLAAPGHQHAVLPTHAVDPQRAALMTRDGV